MVVNEKCQKTTAASTAATPPAKWSAAANNTTPNHLRGNDNDGEEYEGENNTPKQKGGNEVVREQPCRGVDPNSGAPGMGALQLLTLEKAQGRAFAGQTQSQQKRKERASGGPSSQHASVTYSTAITLLLGGAVGDKEVLLGDFKITANLATMPIALPELEVTDPQDDGE